MRKYIVCGIILLFVGLAIMPSIYADRDKEFFLEQTPEIDTFDYDGYTPIQLVFLLINKLRYYEGIESEEDVLEIIENDAELSCIVEALESYSCGCEDERDLEWRFPVICTILYPLWIISVGLLMLFRIHQFVNTMDAIGNELNCFWA